MCELWSRPKGAVWAEPVAGAEDDELTAAWSREWPKSTVNFWFVYQKHMLWG